MMKFLLSTITTVLLLPLFLQWGMGQTDKQLDKMQEDAFDTPGADAPITPPVALGALGVILGHFVAGGLFGLRVWQSIFSLLLGAAGGVALFVAWMQRNGNKANN